jgi:EAL domain-containing protein (putative c-di-GMP-specific phosphodiesterase class I)
MKFNHAIKYDVESIIERIKSESSLKLNLQPIEDTEKNIIFGYEVLSRWEIENATKPDLPFKLQDIIALSILFEEMHSYPEGKLFINCSLTNIEYFAALFENTKITREIVIELDFGFELFEIKSVLKHLETLLKYENVSLAIDDIGRYDLDPNLINLLNPRYLKVDICIGIGIATNIENQKQLKYITMLAERIGAMIIVEGVERKIDAEYLKKNEYILIQGFYYHKPQPWQTYL